MAMNISINKEPLEVRAHAYYILIDGDYLNDLKCELSNLSADNLYLEARSRIFIYNDTPFAEFQTDFDVFTIDMIQQVDREVVDGDSQSFFSTDTGLLILCEEVFLRAFIESYDYEALIDHPSELIDEDYWGEITSHFPRGSFGIIVSPGINSGCDFIGSGLYRVVP